MTVSIVLIGISLLGIGYLVLTQTQYGNSLIASVGTEARQSRPGAGSSVQSSQVRPTGQHSNASGLDSTNVVEEVSRQTASSEADSSTELTSRMSGVSTSSTPIETQIDPVSRSKVMGLLQEARHQLGAREISEAKSNIAEARPYARDFDTKSMLERMATLANYVETYWQAADDQIASFQAGNETTLGGQRVMIVEKTDQVLIVRAAGKNRTIDLQDVPTKLAVHLADLWLDDDAPSTKVFRGAMMAVTPGYDPETARQLWLEAEASGEIKLGDLIQVLDDRYELGGQDRE